MKKFRYLKISRTKKLRYLVNYYQKKLYVIFLPGFMSDIDGEKPTTFNNYAKKNKLDGVVCSPNEIKYVRKNVGKKFIIVTPGIRIDEKVKSDDQKRIQTPRKAIDLGADYLVIGRPITMSKHPLKVLKEINNTLS